MICTIRWDEDGITTYPLGSNMPFIKFCYDTDIPNVNDKSK